MNQLYIIEHPMLVSKILPVWLQCILNIFSENFVRAARTWGPKRSQNLRLKFGRVTFRIKSDQWINQYNQTNNT